MPRPSENTTFEVLTHDECIELLTKEEIGRLAWCVGATPHLVPLNYAWDGEAVVVRSDPGSKLNELRNAEVAFEIDRLDRLRREGTSVVVHGTAHEVSPDDWPATATKPDELYLEPWIPGAKPHLVRVVPHEITGRRIRRHDDTIPPLWILPGDSHR